MLRVNPTGTKAWYVQLDRNHKRKISDAGLLSASVARYRARDFLVRQAIANGKSPGTRGKRTLGEFLEGPYTRLKHQNSPYVKRDIKRLCSALGDLTQERLEQLGSSSLERWKLMRSRKVKPATVNREITMLKTALNQAREWGYLADNPADRIMLRADTSPEPLRILAPAERERLEEILSRRTDRFATLVHLALNTGLRRNELFALRWKDVYFGPYPSIIVEKAATRHHNKNRRIPLNKGAANKLLQWRSARADRTYLVFPSPSGGHLQNVNTAWKNMMAEAGIRNFRLNDCRDDFAVRLVQAGVPLSQVRDLLGHRTLMLTEKYSEYTPGKLSDAVAHLDPQRPPAGDQNRDL